MARLGNFNDNKNNLNNLRNNNNSGITIINLKKTAVTSTWKSEMTVQSGPCDTMLYNFNKCLMQ